MRKLFSALAAGLLALLMLAPPATARCWWHNHHRYCRPVHPHYRPYAYYPVGPPAPAYYPYAYRPYYRPYYICFPVWPFCWWG